MVVLRARSKIITSVGFLPPARIASGTVSFSLLAAQQGRSST
jgi:hypothetical protein